MAVVQRAPRLGLLLLHVEHDGRVLLGVPLADPEVGDGDFGAVYAQGRVQSLWNFRLGWEEIKSCGVRLAIRDSA